MGRYFDVDRAVEIFKREKAKNNQKFEITTYSDVWIERFLRSLPAESIENVNHEATNRDQEK